MNLWNSLPEKVVITSPFIQLFQKQFKLWNGYLYELEPIPIRRMQYFEESYEEESVETDVGLQAYGLRDVK